MAIRHVVSPRYFSTLGIPLRAGRDFDERDNTRVPHVVIINDTFARRFFPGENPIGRTLVTGMAQRPSQVVGVVADIRGEQLNTLSGAGILHAGAAAAGGLHQRAGAQPSCARLPWRRWCARRCAPLILICRCCNRTR